jgi:hypothetical protein
MQFPPIRFVRRQKHYHPITDLHHCIGCYNTGMLQHLLVQVQQYRVQCNTALVSRSSVQWVRTLATDRHSSVRTHSDSP